ncbi:hypothetical protein CAT56_00540 [Acinetobacter nosocomialis]|nr:hypothetical protein B9X80_02370 [Acinetobacter nosocomialis]OTU52446.1 hypothetical protein CAT56_00540 [Acinetobacter nosocomialis]
MLSIFRFVINLFYIFVFYKYISMSVRRYFHFKKNLISKLMQPSDTKYGLGTAIAKA